MHYWLFKSEPTTFSIDNLMHRPQKTDYWNGVRNYQVRNMLRDQIKINDLAFFYHSSCAVPGIIGIIKIVRAGYPDFTAWDKKSDYYDPASTEDNPRWFMVDVCFIKKFDPMITLDKIKQHPVLKHMQVAQRGNRLSITPVNKEEWDIILRL